MNLPLIALLLAVQAPQIAPETLARYAGRYELEGRARALSPDDPVYRVTVENGAVHVTPPGSDKDRLSPLTATRFKSDAQAVEVTFDLDPSGQAARMIIHYKGYDIPAKRVSDGGR